MTERLSQLLHEEADHLDVPPVAADAALSRGRGMRRRRTAVVAGAAAGTLLVVCASALVIADGDDDRAVEPAGAAANVPAFAVGSKVYLGERTATVPDTVHSLHYTSEGVLVRSNPNGGASDGSGPESLTLVRYDGSTVDLGTIPEGVGPATDPDESVYVLAEARGDGFAAVVRDAESGDTVEQVPLPDLPPSYWDVPPLALDGDTLYVGYKAQTAAVDLATGEHHVVEGMSGGIPDVLGGRILTQGNRRLVVVDARTGEPVRTFDTGSDAFGSLSSDGRYLVISDLDDETLDVISTPYEVATGEPVDLGPLAAAPELGWTAAGDAFAVAKGTVTTCDLDTGDCSRREVPIPANVYVKLGGVTYES